MLTKIQNQSVCCYSHFLAPLSTRSA